MPSSHDDTSDWTPDIPGSLYRPAIWRRQARELAQQAGREPLSKLAEQLEALLAQLRTQGINSADINPLANGPPRPPSSLGWHPAGSNDCTTDSNSSVCV